jgi:hypothetical protein
MFTPRAVAHGGGWGCFHGLQVSGCCVILVSYRCYKSRPIRNGKYKQNKGKEHIYIYNLPGAQTTLSSCGPVSATGSRDRRKGGGEGGGVDGGGDSVAMTCKWRC